ncbi:MAG: DUF6916 family protein [Acidimicrobiia bacterium]
MEISRRSVLRLGGGAAVVCLTTGIVPLLEGLGGRAAGATGGGLLDRFAFEGYLGGHFRLGGGASPVIDVVLDEVSGPRQGPADGLTFSLDFTDQRVVHHLDQGTYTIANDEVGAFHAFVVPVGRGGSVQDYQVIFNRDAST